MKQRPSDQGQGNPEDLTESSGFYLKGANGVQSKKICLKGPYIHSM